MSLSGFMSLSGKSLRQKMHLAFALMSIIPLLIMAYLVTGYIFPSESGEINFIQISVIVILAIWVALTGLMLAKEIILPVVNLSLETKIIASGEYNSDLLKNEKELGDIASAVSNMTGQIKGYVGELQQYHERTYSLNAKIHHKVLTLTNLMRLGDMISSGSRFKEIADFATIRMAEEITGGFCALYVKEPTGKYSLVSSYDKSGKFMESANIAGEMGTLEKELLRKGYILLNVGKKELFGKTAHLKKLINANIAFVPMAVNSTIAGIIVIGNFEKRIKIPVEEISVFRAYAKELVLAFESEKIGKKLKSVDVIDPVTGLYSFSYLEDRLGEEINRSVYYQRPCSLIILELSDFDAFAQQFGEGRAEHILKRVSEMLSKIIPPVGKIGRFDFGEFGILLPERNKRESMEMAERIVDQIAGMNLLSEKEGKLILNAGVGENPIDGASSDEIIQKARAYKDIAKNNGGNCVVGWE